jgi:phosphonate transport system permease protein
VTAETQARPVEPIKALHYAWPLLVGIVAVGATGLVGFIGPLWGLAISAATFAVFAWQGITREAVDAVVLAIAGAVGIGFFRWVLDGRSTVIDLKLALLAAVGWLLFGLAAGYVVVRNHKGLRPGAVAAQGFAWAGGALLAMLTAASMGLIEHLNNREIAAGEIQALTIALFVVVALTAAAFGLGTAFSLWTGLPTLFAGSVVIVGTILAYNQIGFSIAAIFTELGRVGELATRFWPPDWTWPKSLGQPPTNNIMEPYIETVQIAIIGATTGSLLAVPLAFWASRATTPNRWVYRISKSFMNVIRTIPDLFWGIFFATAVGFGNPFAGALAMFMFSLAIMAKLLSETVDAIDLGPLEAGHAAGAKHSQVTQYAAFPQVRPNYVAYSFYIFELNIRASVILGFVGAGGIGRLLNERRNFFQWDQVMAIVLVIFVTVLIIETVSIYARRKLI